MTQATLTGIIHGHAKVGKSWLLNTMPAPRLILDAEGGARYAPTTKVYWNPIREKPPVADGSWDTCIVYAIDYDVLERAYQWLASGEHQFVSVGHDHLTEIQERVISKFNGTSALREADWGTLLRHMKDYIRKHRDLVFMPNTIECVLFAAATQNRDGRIIPMMQGGIRDALPYLVDLIGYMWAEQPEDAPLQRKLLINPIENFEAGDRTDALTKAYGPVITIKNPDHLEWGGADVSDMLAVIEGGGQ